MLGGKSKRTLGRTSCFLASWEREKIVARAAAVDVLLAQEWTFRIKIVQLKLYNEEDREVHSLERFLSPTVTYEMLLA